MKKWVLIIVALAMVISSLFVGQAHAFERNKGISGGEFLCGVLGGVALGAIANNLIGKDPVTFIAALIGGVIGARTCDDLNNEEKQAIYSLVSSSFAPRVTGTHEVETRRFHAFVDITAKGWRNGVDGATEECLYFRASVYQSGANGKFLGRTERAYWACGSANGTWQVVTSGVTMDNKSGYYGRSAIDSDVSYVETAGSKDTGSLVVTKGTSLPVNVNLGKVWNLKTLPRWVYDPASAEKAPHLRPLMIMNRDREVGYIKGVTPDGAGGAMSVDIEDYQPGFSENDIGIECDYTNYCRSYKLKVEATINGQLTVYKGPVRFIFKNGDVGVRDSKNDWRVIPAALAR